MPTIRFAARHDLLAQSAFVAVHAIRSKLLILIFSALSAGLLSLPLAANPPVTPNHIAHAYDPAGATVIELTAALSDGEITSRQLINYYIARIAAYDDRGPEIRAILQLDKSALRQAAASDWRRRKGVTLGPLDGIPILVKDNIDVKGMPTTAGSVALKFNYPADDAELITRLRAAGAVILGKTNMSELAASYGRLGYSSIGGLTLNPVDLRRNASGSSSGSAAAVAADFAPVALGTDTSGSIRGPASSVGEVGMRGTHGLVPLDGVVPYSSNLDVVGPIVRSAADAALVLSVMSGTDVSLADPVSVAGLRIGVIDQFSGPNTEVASALASSALLLESLGATTVPVSLSADLAYAWTPIVGPFSLYDLAHELDEYLMFTNRKTPKTAQAVVNILTSDWALSLPTPPNQSRVQGIQDSIDAEPLWGSPEYLALLDEVRPALQLEIETLMAANDLDLLLYPSMECPASPRYDIPDPTWICDSGDEYAPSYVSPATGFPEITVPAALDSEGLPIGMSLLGLAGEDALVLTIGGLLQEAADAEAATPSVPPLPKHGNAK